MECPECKSKTKVLQTHKYAGTVYKKRKCLKCDFVYYTKKIDNDKLVLKEVFSYCKKMFRNKCIISEYPKKM